MLSRQEQDLRGLQAKLRAGGFRIAADSQVVTYVVQAVQDTYDPEEDSDNRLRPERVAAFRLAVYEGLVVLPQVLSEIGKIPDLEREKMHRGLRLGLMLTLYPTGWEQSECIDRLRDECSKFHPKLPDCRVVAEARCLGIPYLITFDRKMTRRLQGNLTDMTVVSPSGLWDKLRAPRGAEPRFPPDPTNPMSRKLWWLADQ